MSKGARDFHKSGTMKTSRKRKCSGGAFTKPRKKEYVRFSK